MAFCGCGWAWKQILGQNTRPLGPMLSSNIVREMQSALGPTLASGSTPKLEAALLLSLAAQVAA